MFASLSRGFEFLKQSITMARADHDLIKPSLMLVGASIVLTLIAIVPMVAVALLTTGDVQSALLGIMGALLIFAQYVLTYFFSGLTVALIYGYITQGDGRMPEAAAAVRRNIGGILTLAVISTIVKLIENSARNRKSILGSIFASILEAVWTTASFFILPAMILENLSLVPAVKRSAQMIKNNLLLVGVSYVGVSAVTGLIGFVAFLAALFLGGIVGYAIAQLSVVVGIVLAVLIVGTAMALLSAATSYITTAYYTCLYMWARNVEQTGGAAAGQQVPAPAPLAAVLAR